MEEVDNSSDSFESEDLESLHESYETESNEIDEVNENPDKTIPDYNPVSNPLDAIEIDVLKETFQLMTSTLYTDQSPSEMISKLVELRAFLDYEARWYRLYGSMRQIHRTILIEDLDSLSVDDMLSYIDLMHYDIDPHYINNGIHMEIAHYLYIQLRRRLENFRAYSYIGSIFFADADVTKYELMDNIPKFDTQPSPKPIQIKEKGVDYYFFRIGELTIEALDERYDFRDLFQMLMMFRRMRWNTNDKRVRDQGQYDNSWFLTNLTRKEDVIRALIASVNDLKLDPRIYLLLDGPESAILKEDNEPSYSIADDVDLDYDNLRRVLKVEGIPTDFDFANNFNNNTTNQELEPKAIPLMFTEYTISQLSPSFIGYHGKHRTLLESVLNDHFTDGTDILDQELDYLVFFGTRDGFSKLIVYHIYELYSTFKSVEDFYDPQTILRYPNEPNLWRKFPTHTIVRLMETVLPLKKVSKAYDLIDLCRKLLYNSDKVKNKLEKDELKLCIDTIRNGSDENKIMVSKALHRMYNVGIQFVEWDEQIDRYDPELIYMMSMKDPLFVPPESNATGRVRAECTNLILHIQETIALLGDDTNFFERLRIVRINGYKEPDERFNHIKIENEGPTHITNINNLSYDPNLEPNYYVTYDDDMYTISNFLEVMHKMANFNLSNVLKVSGLWLMTTANVYHKLILGYSLNSLRFDIEYE